MQLQEKQKKTKNNKAITLIALVITIIVLLLLAGIAIASLGGENGIFAKVKQAKKANIESEMKEQLTMGLQELQIAKQGNATLDDVTQDWANEAILSDYSPVLQEYASLNGKLIIMTKDNVKGKFLIGQNLDIETIEYNTSSVEIEYTTISRTDNKVKINIVVTDKINGVKQIEYPEGNPLKVVSGTKEQISIDYEVELGKEYKFVITTGDGNKTEKIIKIDDYYYNVTKDFGESVTIDNNATKAAYNKTYEATISTEGNYAITSLVVTMGGKTVTTSGNDIVDINTGKIKIEKVTDDINIKVTTEIDLASLEKNIIIKPSTTEWTNKNIQVEVEWGFDSNTNVKKEISIDGGTTYEQYTDAFEVEKNTTIIAKMTVGEIEITKELPITNIDKLPPKDFTPTISVLVSSTELTINANTSDTEATGEYGSSGIKGYQYYVYKGSELINKSEVVKDETYKVSDLISKETYKIYVIAYDEAGNSTKSNEISGWICDDLVYECSGKETKQCTIGHRVRMGYFKDKYWKCSVCGKTFGPTPSAPQCSRQCPHGLYKSHTVVNHCPHGLYEAHKYCEHGNTSAHIIVNE